MDSLYWTQESWTGTFLVTTLFCYLNQRMPLLQNSGESFSWNGALIIQLLKLVQE
jgi:hypothetical protein